MTRQQLQDLFPDTYSFFKDVDDSHPFWVALEDIRMEEMRNKQTLLPDMEQVFASLHTLKGYEKIHEHLAEVKTYQQLMELFTKLYIAYLYRSHGARMVRDVHGYDIEMEISDELLAMGIVMFHDFRSPRLQFSEEIGDEVAHLKDWQEESGDTDHLNDTIERFIEQLKAQAEKFKEHPQATRQVMASVTSAHGLPKEYHLAKHFKEHPEEMQKDFPHIAGIVLVDPTPGKERAHFVAFHESYEELEQLLNKNNQ